MKKKTEKDKEKPKVDYNELITKNLFDFKMVADYSGYQFTRLDLNNKMLEALSPLFKELKYVETIDLSGNSLTDVTVLASLPLLVSLDLSHNNVKDFKAFNVEQGWKQLRTLNLNYNKIGQLGVIAIPNLMNLHLIENKIQKLQTFTGHPKLKTLQLRRNKISSLAGLANLPQLSHLYLAENKIKVLTGLDVPAIKVLHLRKNVIATFDETLPPWEQLTYLNLRENLIEKIEEIYKTKELKAIVEIVISCIKLRAIRHAEQLWRTAQDEKKRLEEQERKKANEQTEAAAQ